MTPSPQLTLNSSIHYLVNANLAHLLSVLGISTIEDLIRYYPREHRIYQRTRINELQPKQRVIVTGKVASQRIQDVRAVKIHSITLTNAKGTARCLIKLVYTSAYFRNAKWLQAQLDRFTEGSIWVITGDTKWDGYLGCCTIDPVIEPKQISLEEAKTNSPQPLIVPIYGLTEGLEMDDLKQAIAQAIQVGIRQIPDPVPQSLLQKFNLIGRQKAIYFIHYAATEEELAIAHRRLAFDEFFIAQLALVQQQAVKSQQQREGFILTSTLLPQFYEQIGFTLTEAQQRVVDEILSDLQKPKPMRRLVQGDVGAGKTVVAAAATTAAVEANYQVALLAPTEVLAEQHYAKLDKWLKPLGIQVELLNNSTRAKKRRQIQQDLRTGKLNVLIGTTAIIQTEVEFSRLGLAIVDEEHRFGVGQRDALESKGTSPHVLTMTATPIPRTLALTIHGGIEVSVIDQLPPGRQPIATRVIDDSARGHQLILREIEKGRQAYIVLPLVDESEKMDLKAVTVEHEELQLGVFSHLKVGLLHGKMPARAKQEALNAFRDHQTQILVCTSVVEVGVDVPNATVIQIEHAERFGLFQLHQLRGRVGRGQCASHCLLVNYSDSDKSQERLAILEQTTDGFVIADRDLKLRGPGEVLGTKQSGHAGYTIANLQEDVEVLETAHRAARMVMARGESLKCWQPLMAEVGRFRQRNAQ